LYDNGVLGNSTCVITLLTLAKKKETTISQMTSFVMALNAWAGKGKGARLKLMHEVKVDGRHGSTSESSG